MSEEYRVELSVNLFVDLRTTIQLEKEESSWKFSVDVPQLNVKSGDHLISLHIKNRACDVRNLTKEQFDPILKEALEAAEKYLVIRIVRGDNPDCLKYLNSKQVRLLIFPIDIYYI